MQSTLGRLDITGINPDACKHLVEIGAEGASANIAAAGRKGAAIGILDVVFGPQGGVGSQRCPLTYVI